MTRLIVTPADTPTDRVTDTTDLSTIQRSLAAVGVRYERWSPAAIADDADDAAILGALADDVTRVQQDGGYVTVDVARLHRGDETDAQWNEKAAGARTKFLAEHTHADDEVRYFVGGAGAFYLRIDGRVHIVLCEAGDWLSVPAGTRHWFDMGTNPSFTALRFFRVAEGWVGDFTGDPIASGFPTFDDLTT